MTLAFGDCWRLKVTLNCPHFSFYLKQQDILRVDNALWNVKGKSKVLKHTTFKIFFYNSVKSTDSYVKSINQDLT